MKKQLLGLTLVVLFAIGCNLVTEVTVKVPEPTATEVSSEEALRQIEVQRQIRIQLSATAIPLPSDPLLGGFSYYEDNALPPGYDPLFAICDKDGSGANPPGVVKLMQNGNGWDIIPSSIEEISGVELTPTGQISDYMRYIYVPSLGQIHLVDWSGNDEKLVADFQGEYNPEYWIWAWSSLMFIKNCRLRIFYIDSAGHDKFFKYDF